MRITRLGPEDAAAYRLLRLESLREDPLGYASAHEDEAEQPLDWFAATLARDAVFVASGDAIDLVGMAGFRVDAMHRRRHGGYIWGMYVRRSHRGQGLGAPLIEAAIAHAGGHVTMLQLAVGAANPAAVRLYTRAGFTIYGTEIGSLLHAGVAYDSHLMVLNLAGSGHLVPAGGRIAPGR